MNENELRFDGRVAIVTGAGAGMGRVHAEFLAARGAHVIVSDRGTKADGLGTDASVADAVVEGIRAAGGSATAYVADLLTTEGAIGAVRKAVDVYGRIDILIHNAGFSRSKPLLDAPIEDFDDLSAINVRAALLMAKEAWPTFIRQQYGRIVITGSTAMYGIGDAAYYATAKSSCLGLTRSLAEAGRPHGIKANLLGPSGATRMAETMPPSEFRDWFLATMRPELVTAVVAYLAHEDAVPNGDAFATAGGRVARILLGENTGIVDPQLTAEGVRDAMAGILNDTSFEPYADYNASAGALMKALGHEAEPVALAMSAPAPQQ